jgi:uracil-DNA glycosylase
MIRKILAGVSEDWLQILRTDDLSEIIEQVQEHCTPPKEQIFEFARVVPLDKVNVVIIGQDPYPTAGDAHGLAFSSKAKKMPASLQNIFKAIGACGEGLPPKSSDLTYWSKQGVLLLNTALTTEVNKPKAHSRIWKKYVDNLIEQVSVARPNAIFLLWGNDAKSKLPLIKSGVKMTYIHPSPLAQRAGKFENCDHFRVANEILTILGKPAILWGREGSDRTEESDSSDSDDKKDEPEWFRSGKYIIAFTDGSCVGNGKKHADSGYSVCFPELDKTILGKVEKKPTNIRAEGEAIFATLAFFAKQLKIKDPRDLVIVTDSDFWIKMFTEHMPKWERKGTDFKEKKNSDMTIRMWKLYKDLLGKKFGKRKPEILFQFVPSHDKCNWSAGDEFERFCHKHNEIADKVANIARENSETIWEGILSDVLEVNGIPEYETDSEEESEDSS